MAESRVSKFGYPSRSFNILFKHREGKCFLAVLLFQKGGIFKRDFYMDAFKEAVSEGENVLLLAEPLV